jgi:YD repeat-containing protein
MHVSFEKYPQDYLSGTNQWTGNTIIDSLIGRNMISTVIEKRDSLYYNGSMVNGKISGAQVNQYRSLTGNTIGLDKQFQLSIASPINDFQPFSFSGNTLSRDSRYRQMVSFDSYDNKNNITQFTAADQVPVSILWDYLNTEPIAKVTNAAVDQVAFTSFEADGKGGWAFSGTPATDASAMTGGKDYTLNGSNNITKPGLSSSKSFVVSYWSKTGSATVNGSSGTQMASANGWKYFEHRLASGISSVTVSGSVTIDGLRLYPSDAQMTSYTYSPLVGMTSSADAGSHISYYLYDALGRMTAIKDQDGNVIKTIQYHYKGQALP